MYDLSAPVCNAERCVVYIRVHWYCRLHVVVSKLIGLVAFVWEPCLVFCGRFPGTLRFRLIMRVY